VYQSSSDCVDAFSVAKSDDGTLTCAHCAWACVCVCVHVFMHARACARTVGQCSLSHRTIRDVQFDAGTETALLVLCCEDGVPARVRIPYVCLLSSLCMGRVCVCVYADVRMRV
jgi:hypothetical protein